MKKEFNELEKNNKEDNTTKGIATDEFKPRKWLLTLLIIISIIIAGYLSYKAIIGIKTMINNRIEEKELRRKQYEEKQKQVEEEMKKITDEIKQKELEDKQESERQEKQFEIASFNNKFEFHTGSQYSQSVSKLLDDVITNNKKNSDKLITVVFSNTTTTNPEEIKSIKSKFEEWHKYEVSLDYNEEGYVNKITIEY